jgi:hypothetical protein
MKKKSSKEKVTARILATTFHTLKAQAATHDRTLSFQIAVTLAEATKTLPVPLNTNPELEGYFE